MILKEMVVNVLENCYGAMQTDEVLNSLDEEFYGLEQRIDAEEFRLLEEILSKYSVRMAHIAYIQGMKDFYEQCLMLKEDVGDIMKKYMD